MHAPTEQHRSLSPKGLSFTSVKPSGLGEGKGLGEPTNLRFLPHTKGEGDQIVDLMPSGLTNRRFNALRAKSSTSITFGAGLGTGACKGFTRVKPSRLGLRRGENMGDQNEDHKGTTRAKTCICTTYTSFHQRV